jgi:hypothetical protein
MTRRRFSVGEAAVTQGDPGDFFFVVESGAFRVEVDGQAVDSVGPSGCFGELALLYNAPRAATVVCTATGAGAGTGAGQGEDEGAPAAAAVVWALDPGSFKRTLAAGVEAQADEVVAALREVHLLRPLTEAQLQSLAEIVQPVVRFQVALQLKM